MTPIGLMERLVTSTPLTLEMSTRGTWPLSQETNLCHRQGSRLPSVKELAPEIRDVFLLQFFLCHPPRFELLSPTEISEPRFQSPVLLPFSRRIYTPPQRPLPALVYYRPMITYVPIPEL